MLFKSTILLAAMASVSLAAPAAEADLSSLFKRASPTGSIPDKIKAPKKGQCGLLVYSATILPIGGAPTTVSGEGIAPSQVGDESAAVINHSKKIIGPAKNLARMSPGFAADIPLNNGKGTVFMKAEYIDGTSANWGISWTYKGKKGQGTGNPNCEQYNMDNGGLAIYNIHSCYFDC